jgi:Rps23 Pro-64 3,4-dihydroxylase Tpa1-like proline 4-hydroxylase
MHAAAAEGIGFFYSSYRLTASRRAAAVDALLRVHEMLDFLNSDEMLAFVSRVTGRDDLRRADGQVTAYTPGHYLTRHRDQVDSEERRLAYVLGLTEEWHPDWGGLLQFYDDDGTPRDAWAPRYNSLALFDVRHVHAVKYVTPYARKPRLSLTGWFHSTE